MRLNLGCGDRYADGWHNVDHAGCPHRKDEAVDVRGDLPWSGVTHAYCGHLLEHLYPGVALSFLARLRRRMAVDGQLMVVGPDVAHAQLLAGLGQLDVPLSSLTDGAGRWVGDEHRWHCTALDVRIMLEFAGWSEVADIGISHVPALWPVADRRPIWQFAVSARP